MIELCHQEEKYLPICKHYRAVFDTPSIQEDSEKMKEVSLTPHWAKSPKKQSDFAHRVLSQFYTILR